MNNKKFLETASKLQKKIKEFCEDKEIGWVIIDDSCIGITAKKFLELEKEGLLKHVIKVYPSKTKGEYKAMTMDGVEIGAYEWGRSKRGRSKK